MSSPILGGAGAWLVSRWGTTIGLLDRSNDRSSHEGVVPKGGGIGIIAAFVFSSVVLEIPAYFWISVAFVALFSLFGDRSEISPKIRLSVQFIAALTFLAFPLYSDNWFTFCPLVYDLRPLRSVLCFLLQSVFVVGTANYYNFMDGIDGIACITGIVAFGMIALFGALSGANESFLILAGCMVFACLGFLPFNMPKARVFMGDAGSVLLGFVYAGLVVELSHSLNDFVVLCAFLFPFYADELTTEYVRLRDGENLLRPHRRHLYQLLANERRISHWKISMAYGVVQLSVGVSILLMRGFGSIIILAVLAVYFGAFILFSSSIRKKLATTV